MDCAGLRSHSFKSCQRSHVSDRQLTMLSAVCGCRLLSASQLLPSETKCICKHEHTAATASAPHFEFFAGFFASRALMQVGAMVHLRLALG